MSDKNKTAVYQAKIKEAGKILYQNVGIYDLLIPCDKCTQKLWELSPIITTYHNR